MYCELSQLKDSLATRHSQLGAITSIHFYLPLFTKDEAFTATQIQYSARMILFTWIVKTLLRLCICSVQSLLQKSIAGRCVIKNLVLHQGHRGEVFVPNTLKSDGPGGDKK